MNRGFAILALAAGAAFWLPGPADAIKEVDSRFGMVGIVLGQTARLNVVIDDPNTTDPPDPGRTCAVELLFLDAMGNVLARSMERLMPGHAAFLDFMFDTEMRPGLLPGSDPSVDDPNIRLQLRGAVRAQAPDGPDRACRGLIATLEVFNSETGRTMVLQNPSVDNPDLRPAGR